jgi:hypothetical protein
VTWELTVMMSLLKATYAVTNCTLTDISRMDKELEFNDISPKYMFLSTTQTKYCVFQTVEYAAEFGI